MESLPSFLVVVRCRKLSEKERQAGQQRFPYRRDLGYRCVVMPSPGVVLDGTVAVFDPDSTAVLKASDPQGSAMLPQEGERRLSYHAVFGEHCTNEELYRTAVRPLLQATMEGYHGTVFAYGMTGSGKSYTMTGLPPQLLPLHAAEEFSREATIPHREVVGMCHYAVQEIFSWKSSDIDRETPMQVHATYVELYNERIRDLLQPDDASVGIIRSEKPQRRDEPDIVEDPVHGVSLMRTREVHVTSVEALEAILEQGNARRTKASTATNDLSSRSHAILQITIRRPGGGLSDGPQRSTRTHLFSKLNLVDLAGSERAHASANMPFASADEKVDRRREGANINKSLLALGNCITSLSQKQQPGRPASDVTLQAHVPYRDSKLTRLLKESLGGNTKTVMIATISPGCSCYEETLSTLKYATRAKSIAKDVRRNVVITTPPPTVAVREAPPRDDEGCMDVRVPRPLLSVPPLQSRHENVSVDRYSPPNSSAEADLYSLEEEVKRLKTHLLVSKAATERLGLVSAPTNSTRAEQRADDPLPTTSRILPHHTTGSSSRPTHEAMHYYSDPNVTHWGSPPPTSVSTNGHICVNDQMATREQQRQRLLLLQQQLSRVVELKSNVSVVDRNTSTTTSSRDVTPVEGDPSVASAAVETSTKSHTAPCESVIPSREYIVSGKSPLRTLSRPASGEARRVPLSEIIAQRWEQEKASLSQQRVNDFLFRKH